MRASAIVLWLSAGAMVVVGSVAGCGGDDTSGAAATSGADCSPKAGCSDVESECVALADNSGKTKYALRMSQLVVTTPKVLAEGLVAGIVGEGVTLDREACYLTGGGTFNWLLEFDTATGKLRTGGAKPELDPTKGYCFVEETIAGVPVAPIEFDAAVDPATGSFSASGAIAKVHVPIYLDIEAQGEPVLLPLSQARMFNGTISGDRNCIGRFDVAGLTAYNNLCFPDPDNGVYTFENGAELDGFVTLEEADGVIVDVLNQSLCVVLSGDPDMYGTTDAVKKCTRDGMGKIILQGDRCAATYPDTAAGCADSVFLAAKFAASGALIRESCP